MFALQPLEQGQAIFDFLQSFRRGVNAVGVRAKKEREVFELTLDALACVHIGSEPRIDGRQFPNPLPHAAETSQDRGVALVERCVRLLAQTLDPLGAGEDLLGRGELLVLACLERRLLDLRQLKRDQVEPRTLLPCVHP